MSLENYLQVIRPVIEQQLKNSFTKCIPEKYSGLRSMVAYHMGWEGDDAGSEGQGKRIRPLLVLLCTEAAGGKWQYGIPAAVAIEFIHNFSLVHDDIQDNSLQRRGRPSLWAKWGIAQAINAGDLLYTMSYLAINGLSETISSDKVLIAAQMLQDTCVQITQGQYLDLLYETQKDLAFESYWTMIEGKTAALIACCCGIGALAADVDIEQQHAFYNFGRSLGLAFQVVDDWLGIWGDTALTGKPVGSDLISGKKTLPILYSLQKGGKFAERWNEKPISTDEVVSMTALMSEEGAQNYTQELADNLTKESLLLLKQAVVVDNEASCALVELMQLLLRRQK